MPIPKKVNKKFFKIWTSEMAYVLGFFAADGYITVNKRGGQFWCIDITDKKLLEDIKKTIQAEHKIGTRLSTRPKEKNSYRLQIGSIEMCNDLRKLGFSQKKTKNLVIPYILKEYFSSFVRGYFDGDGNVWMGIMHKERKTKTHVVFTAFTSCSLSFLRDLKVRLREFGIEGGSLYSHKTRGFSRLQFSTVSTLKLYNFMYNELSTSKLFLKRKKDVFERYKKMRL